ncbi:MAG: SDR family NAD(P)-dependent oxidoreductase [Chthoniobacterales bacterium]
MTSQSSAQKPAFGNRYQGKHVVITGGGSGIGRAMSLRFAAEGADVSILDYQKDAATSVCAEIESAGGSGRAVEVNVADATSVKAAFESIPEFSILVNNAGIAHIGTVESTSPEDLDRIYSVNVKGVYLGMHYAVPRLLARGGGVILNLASIASKIALQDRFAYSMSKGAVLSMTLSVAKDYVKKGIRCNCMCPARVHTPFVDGYLEKNHPDNKEEMFRILSEYQPIGRMGTPEEVASLALFLCSDEASFITGSAYDIDGGVTLLR